MQALQDIYNQAQAAMDRFSDASGFSCIPNCGACCEGFTPDIRPAEAAYLAIWLLGPGREKLALAELDPTDGTCPFYSREDPHHCQVYPARFLICRLFGFSGMRTKHGKLEYSLCFALAEANKNLRQRWSEEELRDAFTSLPPLMSDYGSAASLIEPESAGSPEPAGQAVRRALNRVGLLLSISEARIGKGERGPEEDGAQAS